MGTNYYLVDEAGRNVLEVGKFYALARAAGVCDASPSCPLTVDHVQQSEAGWTMAWSRYQPGRADEQKDVEWSKHLAGKVRQWLAEVPEGPVTIHREEVPHPWPVDEMDRPLPDTGGWALWTLYTHPVHQGAEPPWVLFPPLVVQ